MFLPSLELVATANSQADVVETGASLSETFPFIGIVAVKDDRESRVVVRKKLSDTASVRHLHPKLEAKDLLIPRDAGVDVGHRKRYVMELQVRDVHDSPGDGNCGNYTLRATLETRDHDSIKRTIGAERCRATSRAVDG
jgi:hypothetical protein